MPATSSAQLRAMYAAAKGRSTLGIPKAVGQEFVQATPKAKRLPKQGSTAATGPVRPAAVMHPDSSLPKMHSSKHH